MIQMNHLLSLVEIDFSNKNQVFEEIKKETNEKIKIK